MTNIFDFTDFKEYLKHYFEEKKRANPRYSYQVLARQTGFNNRGFIHSIVQGSKRISKSHCYKISKALGHDKRETEYFETIVSCTQAKSDEERTFFLQRALGIRNMECTETQSVREDQYEFYSTWYHSAIRSLIGMFQFSNEFEQIGKMLTPALSAGQVKNSIRLLSRLGLIVLHKDGIYRLSEKNIRIGDGISNTAKNHFHAECTELAKNAISTIPHESRTAISLTLGMSQSTYELIREETEQFKNRIISLVANAEKADCVYQYQLILFPISNNESVT